MGPKATKVQIDDLFMMRLDQLLKMSHPLIKLANTLNWPSIEQEFSGYFVSTRGRPALPSRLVAGLLYLQHAFNASDEMVVGTWLENPYWQYFTGETHGGLKLQVQQWVNVMNRVAAAIGSCAQYKQRGVFSIPRFF